MSNAANFVAHLKKLDAAALAELRRSLAFEPGTYSRSFPYVERFVGTKQQEQERPYYYLLAGLYAYVERAPEKSQARAENSEEPEAPRRSLGTSIAQIRDRNGEMSPSTEARFIHLLDAAPDELPHPLRQIIALYKAQQGAQPIDWVTLLQDLTRWHFPDRRVQKTWARHFYAPSQQEVEEPSRRNA